MAHGFDWSEGSDHPLTPALSELAFERGEREVGAARFRSRLVPESERITASRGDHGTHHSRSRPRMPPQVAMKGISMPPSVALVKGD